MRPCRWAAISANTTTMARNRTVCQAGATGAKGSGAGVVAGTLSGTAAGSLANATSGNCSGLVAGASYNEGFGIHHRSTLMLSADDVVIIAGVRTPIGKFQGSLSDVSAPKLGALVVREAVKRAGIDPAAVNECIMGNVVSAGLGQNPARQAAIYGGLPPSVGAMTVNKVCGSGLKSVALAAQAIQPGNRH